MTITSTQATTLSQPELVLAPQIVLDHGATLAVIAAYRSINGTVLVWRSIQLSKEDASAKRFATLLPLKIG